MTSLLPKLLFRPFTIVDLAQVMTWRYEPPYDVYNFSPHAVVENEWPYFEDEKNGRFYTITTPDNELIAFCTFFADAQVPGGDYSEDALDIGLGIRPAWTGLGKGVGLGVITAVLAFATTTFHPTAFRVTIAAFNQRAQHVWQQAGFQPRQRFGRTGDDFPFIIFTKPTVEV
ncbi:MAG: GNAT family N-acetyltransferase [Anaerolineales bacterium]|nr:GNAT family N-acetyltransferase [Anaerolineales bacterium]